MFLGTTIYSTFIFIQIFILDNYKLIKYIIQRNSIWTS